MDRARKTEIVSELREVFSSGKLMVVARHRDMSVAESTRLREKMRQEGAYFQVVKNRLARIALENTAYERVCSLLKGPTALAYSDDPVAAARVAVSYAEDSENFEVLGGISGDRELDQTGVKALAKTPPLDESRSRIAGAIATSAVRIASIFQTPGRQFAGIVSAYADSRKTP